MLFVTQVSNYEIISIIILNQSNCSNDENVKAF